MSEVVTIDAGTGEILDKDDDARQIGELYEKSKSSLVESVYALYDVGRRLVTKKESLAHGEWLPWLKANHNVLRFGDWTAQRLMKLSKTWLTTDLDEAHAAEISRQIWSNGSRVQVLTGNVEWYTPPHYIEAAKEVMGSIDLDPASSDYAQEKVQAGRYYTTDDDGLSLPWEGNVWLNPPYSATLVKAFVDKLLDSPIDQAILLTNNATDTAWWHEAAGAAAAICFHRGRIQFYRDGADASSPTHGQTFFYLGTNKQRFTEVFMTYGFVR